MLGAFEQVEVERRVAFLEQRGTLRRRAAVLSPVHHQERHRKLMQPLPDGNGFLAAAARRLAALEERLEIFSQAHTMALFQRVGRDQGMVEKILLQERAAL